MGDRGIVICGGGRYLLSALVNVRILRDQGCVLPIELWHFADEPMPWFVRRKLAGWGVTARALPDLPTGYASKPYAILHSRFEEVLFLDADNTPIRNPEYLFDSEAWRHTGAVFWPDYQMAPADAAWREIAGIDPVDTLQQESGQLLIDKRLHRSALERTMSLNREYHRISPLLWGAKGDKDTFQLGWYGSGHRFHMVETYPGGCGFLRGDTVASNTIVQHDTGGQPLFLHKNGRKWHLVRRPQPAWETMVFLKAGGGCATTATGIMKLKLKQGDPELLFRPPDCFHAVAAPG